MASFATSAMRGTPPCLNFSRTVKSLLVLFLLLVSLPACLTKDKDDNVTPTPPAAKVDANKLGFAIDLTKEYANVSATTFLVINIDSLYALGANRLVLDESGEQEIKVHVGEDALDYTKSISAKLKVSFGLGLFKGSLTRYESTRFRSDIIYAGCYLMVVRRRLKFNPSADVLKNYLTPEFRKDIETQTPEYIVKTYGTHVLSHIMLGGRLEVLYRSETTNTNKKGAASGGLESKLKDIFGLDISGKVTSSSSVMNSQQKLYYRTVGGNPSIGLIGEINLDTTISNKIKISDWQSSVVKENSELIDIAEDGLIPLYDLVEDPTKATAVKNYIIQYLKENQVFLEEAPLKVNQYYSKTQLRTNYSIEDLPSINGSFIFEKAVFKAYNKHMEGTVPVYQYYDAAKNIYLFSTNEALNLQNTTRKGIAYYAFKTQVPGTQPVYEYQRAFKKNKKLYFDAQYSLSNQIPAGEGWSFQGGGAAFYAYP